MSARSENVGRLEEAIEMADDATFRVANIASSYFGDDDPDAREIIKAALEVNGLIRQMTGAAAITGMSPYETKEREKSAAGRALDKLKQRTRAKERE